MKSYNTRIGISIVLMVVLLGCNSSPRESAQVKDALLTLGKLDAGTQVGINRTEYSRLLLESQAKVNEATEIVPESDLRKELILAIDSYKDAQEIWDRKDTHIAEMARFRNAKEFDVDKWIGACVGGPPVSKNELENELLKSYCDEKISRLVTKYKIPLRDHDGQPTSSKIGRIGRQEALNLIWASGRVHVSNVKAMR